MEQSKKQLNEVNNLILLWKRNLLAEEEKGIKVLRLCKLPVKLAERELIVVVKNWITVCMWGC